MQYQPQPLPNQMPLTLSMKSNAYNVTECPYYSTLSVDLELNNTIKKYRENNNKKLREKKKTFLV